MTLGSSETQEMYYLAWVIVTLFDEIASSDLFFD